MEERLDIMHGDEGEAPGIEAYPEWLQKRLEWFQDLKFGLFLHWGVYCQWDCCESWPLVPEDTWARNDRMKCWTRRGKDIQRFQRDYWALNKTFNPTQFDPAVWADAARYAGMKYVDFTTKHHDGFCMWDTRTTDYRVTHPDCPFHKDPRSNIVKEVFNAFRGKGLAISCYFSKSDWKTPYYWSPDFPIVNRNPNYDTHARPDIWAKFVDYVHHQIEELMTGFGRIDVLWLDGGQVRPPDQDIDMPRMAAMARKHQPGLIVADRTVGGIYENIVTPEHQIPDEPLKEVWESCLTMSRNWKYSPNDTYKSTHKVLHMLIEIVSKGGNFLLGVGPKPDGTLPADALKRLREIGDWMAVNAEAIHGTRAVAPYKEGNIRFTQKSGWVYAVVMPQPGEDQPSCYVTLTALQPAEGTDVTLLGLPKPLAWRKEDGNALVEIPTETLPCQHAWVLKFTAR